MKTPEHKRLANSVWKKNNPDKNKARRMAWNENNREKLRATNNRWQKANPDKTFNSGLKCRYGIDAVEYYRIFEEQNGKCAICQVHQDSLKQRLAVDHNHITGAVRGLLCRPCNQAIGVLKCDSGTEVLLKAIAYIERKT